jgi:Domain of unknown function (DUF6970)
MNFRKRSIALALLIIAACSGHPAAPDTSPASPTWVTALIGQIRTEPVTNPPAFVVQYHYRGQDVYFVPQRCCDIMSVVYSSDGTIMCHPDGGVTGKGDGLCPDFFVERRNERIVWRDSKR